MYVHIYYLTTPKLSPLKFTYNSYARIKLVAIASEEYKKKVGKMVAKKVAKMVTKKLPFNAERKIVAVSNTYAVLLQLF